MSLLLKLKERFSNEQVETNNVINEYSEEIDSKTENKEKDVNKDNEKVRADIDIQALANALQYIHNFNYSSENSELKRIRLDKNIKIETIDLRSTDYDDRVERMLPVIKLRILINGISVRFLILKRNIYNKWITDVQHDTFPMSIGIIKFINKWSEDQLNKKRKAEELKENKKKEEQQIKLDRLIEVYEEYKKYEE